MILYYKEFKDENELPVFVRPSKVTAVRGASIDKGERSFIYLMSGNVIQVKGSVESVITKLDTVDY